MGTTDEADIRHQRELWKAAFEAGDADRVMSFYATGAETVAFDILPPLQFAGWDAYKADWGDFLKPFDSKIAVETRCSVPGCDGASSTLTRQEKDALWEAVSTAAPERRRVFEPNSKQRKRRPAPSPEPTASTPKPS